MEESVMFEQGIPESAEIEVGVCGMVFPTTDADFVPASDAEIAADNRLIDMAAAAGMMEV